MEAEIKLHPVCEIFPPMSDEEFHQLKADIAENGQRESIVYWNQMLVDGRHRLRACKELNIEPMEVELELDQDPVAYALSCNLHRRHLTESQRGMVSAELAKLKHGDNQHTKEDRPIGTSSIEEASKLLNVSERTTKRAKSVLKNGCKELQQLVKDGKLSVSKAEEIANGVKCPKEQVAIARDFIESPKAASNKKEPKTFDIGKLIMTSLADAEIALDAVSAHLDLDGKVPPKITEKIHAIGNKVIKLLKALEK